jgi:hypothetical protein
MKGKLQIALGIVVMGACMARAEAGDDWIKDMVIVSGQFIHGGEPARRMFENAKSQCEGDTNRFARLLCELAQTNDVRIADRMIRCLGRHGTTSQLPFLYSMATNEQHGATAVKSILRLEGVTSNSVAVAGMYLSMTNVDFEYRADACKALLRAAAPSCVTTGICQMARNCALRYARSANRYVMDVDAVFIETDSTYRNSKRRLAVLRSAYGLGVSQYQIAYVTNAINELVAYPEADLPE